MLPGCLPLRLVCGTPQYLRYFILSTGALLLSETLLAQCAFSLTPELPASTLTGCLGPQGIEGRRTSRLHSGKLHALYLKPNKVAETCHCESSVTHRGLRADSNDWDPTKVHNSQTLTTGLKPSSYLSPPGPGVNTCNSFWSRLGWPLSLTQTQPYSKGLESAKVEDRPQLPYHLWSSLSNFSGQLSPA